MKLLKSNFTLKSFHAGALGSNLPKEQAQRIGLYVKTINATIRAAQQIIFGLLAVGYSDTEYLAPRLETVARGETPKARGAKNFMKKVLGYAYSLLMRSKDKSKGKVSSERPEALFYIKRLFEDVCFAPGTHDELLDLSDYAHLSEVAWDDPATNLDSSISKILIGSAEQLAKDCSEYMEERGDRHQVRKIDSMLRSIRNPAGSNKVHIQARG